MKNNPIDHHYVPVFYLKRWVSGSEKKLWYYQKNVNGKIVEGKVGPKSTGFEPNLNTLISKEFSGINNEEIFIIEKKLANLDSEASKVLNKMIGTGIPSLSDQEKRTWLNFVLLLFERNSDRIKTIENEGEKILKDVIDDSIEKWGNSEQWYRTYKILKESEFTYNYARIRLHDFMKDESLLNDHFIQNWIIVKTHAPFEFLTSNFPVIVEVSKKISNQISFIEMPISPKKMWICAPRDFKFGEETIKLLASTFSTRLMMVRPKYVYSLNRITDVGCLKYSKVLNAFL